MYAFDYNRPKTLAEAVALITSDDVKPVSGGQTLIPTLKQRLSNPTMLVDLANLSELRGIIVQGGWVALGAATRHAEVQFSKEVQAAFPALADLAGGIGDPAVRNMGTCGGSIANNDPAADYPAALLATGGSVKTNKREIKGDDFFLGMFETALQPGEIITRVDFPIPTKAAYMKFRNPASRYAIVGVFVAQNKSGPRVAVTGAGPVVFRWKEAEEALAKNWSVASVENLKASADGLNSDIHASAEYRAHLIGVMLKRAVAKAG